MGRKGQTKRKAASYAYRTTPTKRQHVARAPPRSTTISPFPIRQVRTITYCDAIALSPTTPGDDVANHVFRATSIFDPDFTGAGHKPYAHDTFETLYTNYSVKSAVIDVNFCEKASEATFNPVMCGVWNNDLSTTIVDPALIREQPGSNSKLLVNDDMVSVRGSYQRDPRIPIYDRGETSATFGANPAESVFFNVFYAGVPALSHDTTTIYAYVKIVYEVEMWEPKKLGTSA